MTHWSAHWPIAYPRANGPWTLRSGDRWGILDPDTGQASEVDPTADERLPGLVAALETGRLIAYRAGRRAVVRTPTGFVKVVRPNRVHALVERHALLAESAGPFSVPAVTNATSDGRIELARVAGRSLHHSIRSNPARSLDDIGTLVAKLHHQPAPGWLPAREPDDQDAWVEISRRSPTSHLVAIEQAASDLPLLEPKAEVIVHGDLHDKNIFCNPNPADGAPRWALIDLDGLSKGSPEEDVANLAVHLELRNLQARTGLCFGARSRALYQSYQRLRPLDQERLLAVERHTWFRLACLYQYRASSHDLVPEVLRGHPRCSKHAASPSEGVRGS